MSPNRLRVPRSLAADRRGIDSLVLVACLLLTVPAVRGAWSPAPPAVIVLASVAGSLAQWQRRRRPQIAAVAGAAAYALSGNPGPIVVGLYSGAAYAPRRQIWALALAGWAGFAGLLRLDAGRLTAADAAYTALGTAVVVAVGVYAAQRRALIASLRERAESAEAERRLRDEQARTAERTRIAREMHDVLAHKVSLIALHAGALEVAAGASADRVQQSAVLIRTTAREALQELRTVLGVLRAGSGDSESFTDLESLVRAAADAGQRIELHDGAGTLPPATARVVHRVAQEGLTNARKHAPDAPASIRVERADDGDVVVTVENARGAGVPLDLPGSGAGLAGLEERIKLVGGRLESGAVGGVWRLRAVVPWDPQP